MPLLVGLSPWTVGADAVVAAEAWIREAPSLNGKVAIVTGGCQGLGLETAKALADKGATVVMASRTLSRCEAAAKEISRSGGEAIAAQLDVASLRSTAKFVDWVLSRFEAIDVLVLNAGGAAGSPDSLQIGEDGVELIFATNVVGHFFMLNRLAPRLDRAIEPPRVVFVTSCLAYIGPKLATVREINDPAAYGALRFYGLAKLASIALALETAARHPKWIVNAAHPGLVRSDDRTMALDRLRARLTSFITPAFDFFRDQVLWSPAQGALTQIMLSMESCPYRGGVFHPVMQAVSPPGDALDEHYRQALWATLQELCDARMIDREKSSRSLET